MLVERVADALQEAGHFNGNRLAETVRALFYDAPDQ